MKTALISLLSVLFVFAQAWAKNFDGAWELHSGEYVNEQNELVKYEQLEMKSMKVISGDHFSFISHARGEFWASGGGEIEYTDNEYIEVPLYTSYQIKPGTQYTFSYKREGDFWYNERWLDGVRVEYEVWKRIKDSELADLDCLTCSESMFLE